MAALAAELSETGEGSDGGGGGAKATAKVIRADAAKAAFTVQDLCGSARVHGLPVRLLAAAVSRCMFASS